MIAAGRKSVAESSRRSFAVGDDTYHKAEWMMSGEDPALSPTIFMIEQPANSTLVAHFHRQNQFQLFVDGSGSIGRYELAPVTVHYAGAYTAYGPLLAGPRGLKYFTIRPVFESGGFAMPESHAQMRRGPRRHAQSEPIDVMSETRLKALSGPEDQVLIPVGADGMGAILTRLPPGASVAPTLLGQAESLFIVVLSGVMHHAGEELGRWESLFLNAGECFPELTAGPEGVEFVTLLTPAKNAAYC